MESNSIMDTLQQAQTLAVLFTENLDHKVDDATFTKEEDDLIVGLGGLTLSVLDQILNLTSDYINDGKLSNDMSLNRHLAAPILGKIYTFPNNEQGY